MNVRRHILASVAVFLLALSVTSCVEPLPQKDYAELMVSLYIPDILATKGETGPVDPTDAEKAVSALQIWVFISNPEAATGFGQDGKLVSYKAFTAAGLSETGLGNGTVTRFGLPLSAPDFTALSVPNAKVDVYAVANADASWGLVQGTTRDQLDAFVLEGDVFGPAADHLTMSATGGLPMSGVLKNTGVTGGYPILSLSSLTLTRAVSKLRFVFVQQGKNDGSSTSLVPLNDYCVINRIVFDGTSNGADCQIALQEKLFTRQKYGETSNLFDITDYTPLAATLSGDDPSTTPVEPLISTNAMACADEPASLVFRSRGFEGESAQAYETRLDAAIAGKPNSQVGPIYLRETDKPISGTIYYSTTQDGAERPARFTMSTDDKLTRNHSWVVYAYFAEETRTLELSVTVLPWSTSQHMTDYTTGTVNVVRRFTAAETSPATFKKVQTDDGFFDVTFWHTIGTEPNSIKGDILIATPVGGKLHAVAVPGRRGFDEHGNSINIEGVLPDALIVTPAWAGIYPEGSSTVEACKIEFEIKLNPEKHYSDAELEGQYIDLHFFVEYNGREIDIGSESIDYYRFILLQNWND